MTLLTYIAKFDLSINFCKVSINHLAGCGMSTEDAYSSEHLMGITCVLMWRTCHVFGLWNLNIHRYFNFAFNVPIQKDAFSSLEYFQRGGRSGHWRRRHLLEQQMMVERNIANLCSPPAVKCMVSHNEGSVPEMRIWSILLIKPGFKMVYTS